MVIELPLCYAMSSASYFATGAINILNHLNTVDYLCFGSECNDIHLLNTIADIIIKEDDCYSNTLQAYLKTGMSFVQSRENAIIKSLAMRGITMDTDYLSSLISSPNSILAIEYIIALKKSNSNIIPVPILRCDDGYHSDTMSSTYASASAIRKFYTGKSVYNFNNIRESLKGVVPVNCIDLLEQEYKKSYPILTDDYSSIIGNTLVDVRYNLLELSEIFDTTEDLANRIKNMSVNYTSATEFINICNSKIFTSSRISRILFYLIFNYKKDDYFLFKADDYVYYFRVLGFRKEKDNLLGEIKNSSPIPIITKLSNSIPNLPENARKMLELNLYADEIYRMVSMNKYCSVIPTEQQYGVIIR
jgi:predicted nucleotidyltransferase